MIRGISERQNPLSELHQPCEEHITTPLQTLDGLYVNLPRRLLPLAQEAKKLKEEEEASQWSGISIETLLNDLFTEQLNSKYLKEYSKD